MDQPIETQTQTPPAPVQPTAPSPVPPTAPAPPPQAPPLKKSHAWIWILGGCAGIIILGIIAMVALGWWGARKAKKELEKFQPDLEQMKENADKWSKEAEGWEKKSEEFRNSMPNPEDFPSPEENPRAGSIS